MYVSMPTLPGWCTASCCGRLSTPHTAPPLDSWHMQSGALLSVSCWAPCKCPGLSCYSQRAQAECIAGNEWAASIEADVGWTKLQSKEQQQIC
jgi:hypothetical protein